MDSPRGRFWRLQAKVRGTSTLAYRSICTCRDHGPVLEEFGDLTVAAPIEDLADCSWIQKIHIPAQAGWVKKWNGTEVPRPHQSEPDDLAALENWWAGAL